MTDTCQCSSWQVIPGALQVHNDTYDLHYDGQFLLFLPTCKFMSAMSFHMLLEYPYQFENSNNVLTEQLEKVDMKLEAKKTMFLMLPELCFFHI